MKDTVKGKISVNNKNYPFIMIEVDKETVHFECDGAGVDQKFHVEDIAGLFLALPTFVVEEQQYRAKSKQVLRFRVSVEEKKAIMKMAVKKGYKTASAFLRAIALGS